MKPYENPSENDIRGFLDDFFFFYKEDKRIKLLKEHFIANKNSLEAINP